MPACDICYQEREESDLLKCRICTVLVCATCEESICSVEEREQEDPYQPINYYTRKCPMCRDTAEFPMHELETVFHSEGYYEEEYRGLIEEPPKIEKGYRHMAWCSDCQQQKLYVYPDTQTLHATTSARANPWWYLCPKCSPKTIEYGSQDLYLKRGDHKKHTKHLLRNSTRSGCHFKMIEGYWEGREICSSLDLPELFFEFSLVRD